MNIADGVDLGAVGAGVASSITWGQLVISIISVLTLVRANQIMRQGQKEEKLVEDKGESNKLTEQGARITSIETVLEKQTASLEAHLIDCARARAENTVELRHLRVDQDTFRQEVKEGFEKVSRATDGLQAQVNNLARRA